MRSRNINDISNPVRYVNASALADYLSLGKQSAVKLARKIGAERRIGRRCIYDTKVVDGYLERTNITGSTI